MVVGKIAAVVVVLPVQLLQRTLYLDVVSVVDQMEIVVDTTVDMADIEILELGELASLVVDNQVVENFVPENFENRFAARSRFVLDRVCKTEH